MSEPTPEPKDINEALLALQADPPLLTKQKKGQVGNQITRYADLPAVNTQVLTRLNALGVIWRCAPTLLPDSAQGAGRFVLRYSLLHVASKTSIDGDYPLGAGEPQKMGSAITYARRYALLAVTGIAAEDDDDDGSGTGVAKRNPPKPRGKAREEASVSRADASPPPLPSEQGGEGPAQGRDTGKMLRLMAIRFGEMDVTDRGERLALLKDMVGRNLSSGNDLTFAECRAVLAAMEKASETDSPLTNVIEIYQRTTGSGSAPPAKAARAKAAPPARSLRESVTGTPGEPNDEPPPWETEPPGDPEEWPPTATPGGAR